MAIVAKQRLSTKFDRIKWRSRQVQVKLFHIKLNGFKGTAGDVFRELVCEGQFIEWKIPKNSKINSIELNYKIAILIWVSELINNFKCKEKCRNNYVLA